MSMSCRSTVSLGSDDEAPLTVEIVEIVVLDLDKDPVDSASEMLAGSS